MNFIDEKLGFMFYFNCWELTLENIALESIWLNDFFLVWMSEELGFILWVDNLIILEVGLILFEWDLLKI